jgi:hypothetical protein
MGIQLRRSELLLVAIVAALASAWVDDVLGGLSILVLWFGVRLLLTDDRIPVLAAVFMYQWMQVTVGIFYARLTGHVLKTMADSDYRPMMFIGLGCVMSLAIGLRLGIYLIRDERENRTERPVAFLSMPVLLAAYAVSVASEGAILGMVQDYPSLRQIFVTITVVRFGLLFLVMRRFCHPVFRPHLLATVLTLEVALGLTGYFASFKDPLILAAIVLFEVFDHRRVQHWVAMVGVVLLMAGLSFMWMGVRGSYRRSMDAMDPTLATKSARIERVNSLATEFFSHEVSQLTDTADELIDRMWAIYYPARALARVPSVVNHTGGTIMSAAITHLLTPRVFFPDKAPLPSDSEMVRKYSGIFVAGDEVGTSIAFGYAAESYVDFGTPWMFAPILIVGMVMGGLYAWFLRTIWHRELAVAVVIVIFWTSLYLFERSWANVLGTAASCIMYVGLPITILDHFLVIKQKKRDAQVAADASFRMQFGPRLDG